MTMNDLLLLMKQFAFTVTILLVGASVTICDARHSVGDVLLVASPTNPCGVPLHRFSRPSMFARIPSHSKVKVHDVQGNWYHVAVDFSTHDSPDGWIVERYVIGTAETTEASPDRSVDGSEYRTALPVCPRSSGCSERGAEVTVSECPKDVPGETRVSWMSAAADDDPLTTSDIREHVSKWCQEVPNDVTEHVFELRTLKHYLRVTQDASISCHTIRYLNSGDNFDCWPSKENGEKTRAIDRLELGESECNEWDIYIIDLVGNKLDMLVNSTNGDNAVDAIINDDLRRLRSHWLETVSSNCPR